MTDDQAGAQPEGSFELESELSSEREKPLEDGPNPEKEQPPATLEQVRTEVSASLKSGLEFWSTSFGSENRDDTFMERQNAPRREQLKKAFAIISDQDVFSDPELLQNSITELLRENQANTAGTGSAELATDELTVEAGIPPAEDTSEHSQKNTEQLQQQLLSLVQELLFEQLYADLLQCQTAIKERAAQVLDIRKNMTELPAGKLEEAVPLFKQWQVDANMFGQYLAHGQAAMDIALKSEEFGQETPEVLKEIINEYSKITGKENITEVVQSPFTSDGMADPITYFENERTRVADKLVGQDIFFEVAEALRERLTQLQQSATQTPLPTTEPVVVEQVAVEQAMEDLETAAGVNPTTVAGSQPSESEQQSPAPEEVGANYGGGDFNA